MSLNGPDALISIEEALRDIRRDEDDVARRLARGAELTSKLEEQSGELVRAIAAGRLEADANSTLVADFSAAEAAAHEALRRQGEELDATATRLGTLDAALVEAAGQRAVLQAEAARRDAELRSLADALRPDLGRNSAYAAKSARARELAAIAEQSLAKTALSEADRAQKGRPFRDDPLFMYLWEKGYGSKGHRANPVTAWIDGKVAGLIGFASARSNFMLLNDIPLRLREHADRLRESALTAARELAGLESAAADEAGGRAAREALEGIVGRIEALDAEMVQLQDQRDELARTQRDLAQGSGAEFAAALGKLPALSQRDDVRSLAGHARLQPRGDDATLLQQLDDLRQRIDEEDDEAREQKTRLKTLAARRRDLEDIQYEFKAYGFDSPQSRFSRDDLAGDALNAFLRGEMNAMGYWELWRASQSWAREGNLGGPTGGGFSRPRGAAIAAKRTGSLTAA